MVVAMPVDANSNPWPVAALPSDPAVTITVTASGAVTLPGAGLYRVFADTPGCTLNGMPLAAGVYEYIHITDAAISVGVNATVATGGKIFLTRVA